MRGFSVQTEEMAIDNQFQSGRLFTARSLTRRVKKGGSSRLTTTTNYGTKEPRLKNEFIDNFYCLPWASQLMSLGAMITALIQSNNQEI